MLRKEKERSRVMVVQMDKGPEYMDKGVMRSEEGFRWKD